MSYRKWREEFLHQFGRAFPNASHRTALALLREASAEQRWNEISCSIDIGERETARQERRAEARTERVRALCARIGATLDENGDPRGCPFTLKTTDGQEIPVPGRGLPASAFR